MKKLFLSLILIISFYGLQAQTDSTQQFVGKYNFPEGSVIAYVDVLAENGALSMSTTLGVSALNHLGIDSFEIVQYAGIAVFKRGEDRNVNAVHIEAAGYVLDGQKQPNGQFNWQITMDDRQRFGTSLSVRL